METIYLFDVDGTLDPPRQRMVPDFEAFFRDFVRHLPVYLISGSDYAKLQEQVPQDILDQCRGVFGCSGAQFLEAGRMVYCKEHDFSRQLALICESFIDTSSYSVRTGNHIEKRPGMLNISVVGRNATQEQRHRYFEWDKTVGERKRFVEHINQSGMAYEASAGGEISIDIVPSGWNKSVAKHEVLIRNPGAHLMFFGDRICHGGNDMPLADALSLPGESHLAIPVRDYRQTWSVLSDIALVEGCRAA